MTEYEYHTKPGCMIDEFYNINVTYTYILKYKKLCKYEILYFFHLKNTLFYILMLAIIKM